MALSAPFTPRSNPGSTPSADVAQTCPLEAFTKLVAFISGAPRATLSAIMCVESEDQLKQGLALIDASDPQTQPSVSVKATCRCIHEWLMRDGERSAASKDIIPLSLLLLLRCRIQNGERGAQIKLNDSAQIAVAFKIAYGNTSDNWMTLKSWARITDVPGTLIKKVEPLFLGILDWRTLVRDDVFTDFVVRVDMLWNIVFNVEKK